MLAVHRDVRRRAVGVGLARSDAAVDLGFALRLFGLRLGFALERLGLMRPSDQRRGAVAGSAVGPEHLGWHLRAGNGPGRGLPPSVRLDLPGFVSSGPGLLAHYCQTSRPRPGVYSRSARSGSRRTPDWFTGRCVSGLVQSVQTV